ISVKKVYACERITRQQRSQDRQQRHDASPRNQSYVMMSQMHLKASKGSRQAVQRKCALQGVEPNSLKSSVASLAQRGQITGRKPNKYLGLPVISAGGAIPKALSLRRPSSLNHSLVHGGESTSSSNACWWPARFNARRTRFLMTSVAGQPQ